MTNKIKLLSSSDGGKGVLIAATATKKIVKTITKEVGMVELVKDMPVGAGMSIAAFAGTANVVTIFGSVTQTR